MTRRDLVWACAFANHFANRLDVLHVEVGEVSEVTGQRVARLYAPSRAELDRIGDEAREVAEMAAERSERA